MGDKMDKAIEKKFIDPTKIPAEDMPLIVLSTHSSGFVQWVIKWRTKASYNHIMMMHRPGYFASQGNVFSEAKISRYMTPRSRLKIWKIKDITAIEKARIMAGINRDLKASWWNRKYDWLGVLIGQGIGLKFLNNPRTCYCSERVARHISIVLGGIPKHPSPGDLNEIFKKHERMELYGYWLGD